MQRDTVDFGIDLGTTNSAAAVMTPDAGPAMVRNTKRRELTPSAVYVDGTGTLHVGDGARNRVERNPRDVATEFKLRMGVRDAGQDFPASGRRMSPVELSAEVLKSLVRDVRRELDEPLDAAVITVPAAFELDQNEATVQAARLAGIDAVTLIQEPSAAAWAYGQHSRDEDGFWLVYDFGGGTFDAAVVRVQDGEFVVVAHAGDNFLGGKLIDWALVEDVLVPALTTAHDGFTGIAREDPRWSAALTRLKLAAEQVKIELSDVDACDVDVELDGDIGRVDFGCRVQRADVERALAPLYARALNLCRRALAGAGLQPTDLHRVLLVGGTTLLPALRTRLADPVDGLGVPLDFSLDPVTVVARGAAVFASTRRRVRALPVVSGPDEVAVQLEFEPVGIDLDPFVAGRLHGAAPSDGSTATGASSDWAGYAVEFADEDARPPWRSGAVPVDASGGFGTRLRAAERTTSTFRLSVHRPDGAPVRVAPGSLSYRHEPGAVGRGTTASHSLGVGLAGNDVLWLIRKGTELPARSPRAVLYTTVEIDKAAGSGLLRVPVVQGERSRADRNSRVGTLELAPSAVRHDLRRGSEVEVVLWMDDSQQVQASAYVPVLDEEFPIELDLGREVLGGMSVRRAATEVLDRHRDLRERATGSPTADRLLDRLAEEDAIREIDRLAAAAQADPDAEQTAWSRIRDALAGLDEIEEQLDAVDRSADLRDALTAAHELAAASGTADDRRELDALATAADQAIAQADPVAVADRLGEVQRLIARLLDRSGELDAVRFAHVAARLADDPDRGIQELLRRGRAAHQQGDADTLREIVRHLVRRRPAGAGTTPADTGGSTVDRTR